MDVNATVRNRYCFHLPDPIFQTASERITTNLITAIVNILAAPIAIITNVLVFTAIFSSYRLRSPSNLLIASLALSDVLVGLTAQPGYISNRLMENQHRRVPCYALVLYSAAFYICFGVSFMTLCAVSYERFVAVRLPGRYRTFFSSTRVVEYVIGIWAMSIFLTAMQSAKIKGAFRVVRGIHLILWLICFLLSSATQMGILFIVRRYRRQLQVQFQASENVRRQREAKLAKGFSVIVGVYLILNLPLLFVIFYHQILGLDLETYNHYSWTETLAFLNSCSNPLICCWKNRQIRQKVKNVFRKIFRLGA